MHHINISHIKCTVVFTCGFVVTLVKEVGSSEDAGFNPAVMSDGGGGGGGQRRGGVIIIFFFLSLFFLLASAEKKQKAETNTRHGGRSELTPPDIFTQRTLSRGPRKRKEKRVCEVDERPARKRWLTEEEWRPGRRPPPPGSSHSPLDAFLSAASQRAQRSSSAGTKLRANSCPSRPRRRKNQTPAVEKTYLKTEKFRRERCDSASASPHLDQSHHLCCLELFFFLGLVPN